MPSQIQNKFESLRRRLQPRDCNEFEQSISTDPQRDELMQVCRVAEEQHAQSFLAVTRLMKNLVQSENRDEFTRVTDQIYAQSTLGSFSSPSEAAQYVFDRLETPNTAAGRAWQAIKAREHNSRSLKQRWSQNYTASTLRDMDTHISPQWVEAATRKATRKASQAARANRPQLRVGQPVLDEYHTQKAGMFVVGVADPTKGIYEVAPTLIAGETLQESSSGLTRYVTSQFSPTNWNLYIRTRPTPQRKGRFIRWFPEQATTRGGQTRVIPAHWEYVEQNRKGNWVKSPLRGYNKLSVLEGPTVESVFDMGV